MAHVEPLARLADHAIALFRDWRVRSSLRRSLQALPQAERSRVLRESGFSVRDFETCLNSAFGSEDLLSRMMRTVGLDADRVRAASPETMRDLEQTCMTCPIKRRCRKNLVSGRAAASYDGFCPNAPILTYLARRSAVERAAAQST